MFPVSSLCTIWTSERAPFHDAKSLDDFNASSRCPQRTTNQDQHGSSNRMWASGAQSNQTSPPTQARPVRPPPSVAGGASRGEHPLGLARPSAPTPSLSTAGRGRPSGQLRPPNSSPALLANASPCARNEFQRAPRQSASPSSPFAPRKRGVRLGQLEGKLVNEGGLAGWLADKNRARSSGRLPAGPAAC